MRIVDASPLIVLSKLSRLDLLRAPDPNQQVLVIQAVLDEVMRGEPGDPTLVCVPQAINTWLQVIPTPTVHPSLQTHRLDPGETSVLSAVLENPGAHAVLDDNAARSEAARLGIPFIGSVGLILVGSKLGLIPSARSALTTLRQSGLYISDELFHLALEQAGESAS